jgi:hypothetical protein
VKFFRDYLSRLPCQGFLGGGKCSELRLMQLVDLVVLIWVSQMTREGDECSFEIIKSPMPENQTYVNNLRLF